MKKIILLIFLLSLCNLSSANLSDELSNYGLYHCDSTNVTSWHTETPDDYSSSRANNPALLEYQSDQPVLVPRSGGGGCFYFDGNNDGLYIPNVSGYIGWPGNQDTFQTDISVKWEDLPQHSGDNRAALIVASVWNVFLKNNGAGKGIIEVLVYDTDNNPTFLTSDVTLNSDTWYEVHAQLSNNVVSLTINGTTKTTSMSGTLKQQQVQVEIGQGIYAARYFKGYLDEIRYGFFQKSFGAKLDNSELMPLYVPDSEVKMEGDSPDWIKTLIMAQFRIETATYEGNFSNAVRVLDHYAEMGVNGLWINPIFERTGNNGYHSFGPHLIDDQIAGTNDNDIAFKRAKEFVDAAHDKNIRIFFDIVIWGVASNSPLVGEHPTWFYSYNSDIDGYFYRTDNSSWREWFIQQVTNLAFATGCDGFRCDTEPATTGYSLWEEVRQRCYAGGKKVAIIAEQYCTHDGTYDFEQVGVGYENAGDWDKIRESGNYYISNNIVDSVTSGVGIGIPESQQGRSRFYSYNLDNHDSHYPISLGNIVRFGYQAILSPFIPMWYIGEEWNCYPHVSAILYFNSINWAKMLEEQNNLFFEKTKQLIRIRRQYPEIFNCYPANHRDANICKITVSGNNLQSYARFKNGKAILIIPNFNDAVNSYSFVPPYDDMGMGSVAVFKVKNLLTDEFISTNLSKTTSINVTISNQNLAVLLVEKNDDTFIPFSDAWNNVLLMHCDATNQGYWLTTPDDNLSGRTANEPILDKSNAANFNFDRTTEPTLMPNSPKGGGYLHFDGNNDSVYVNPGWGGGKNVFCDFSLKYLGLPPASDPYAALIQTVPWRCYLGNDGTIKFFINSSTWLNSSKVLNSNTWYDVHFSLTADHASLIVDDTTNTATVSLSDSSAQIMIGYDIYTLDRFFNGDMDEIRVGYIPEPVFIFYFLLLIFTCAKRK